MKASRIVHTKSVCLLLFLLVVVCLIPSCVQKPEITGTIEDEVIEIPNNETTPYLMANEIVAQIIDSFLQGTIDTAFPYAEIPPEGIVFPSTIREEIGSGASSFGLYEQKENRYLVEVLCFNSQSNNKSTFMYVDFHIKEDGSEQVFSISFSDTRIEIN